MECCKYGSVNLAYPETAFEKTHIYIKFVYFLLDIATSIFKLNLI